LFRPFTVSTGWRGLVRIYTIIHSTGPHLFIIASHVRQFELLLQELWILFNEPWTTILIKGIAQLYLEDTASFFSAEESKRDLKEGRFLSSFFSEPTLSMAPILNIYKRKVG